MGMLDIAIALGFGLFAGGVLYGICHLLDAFVAMQTGEDVALEDVPPTRPYTRDVTEIMAQVYRDHDDKAYQQ